MTVGKHRGVDIPGENYSEQEAPDGWEWLDWSGFLARLIIQYGIEVSLGENNEGPGK